MARARSRGDWTGSSAEPLVRARYTLHGSERTAMFYTVKAAEAFRREVARVSATAARGMEIVDTRAPAHTPPTTLRLRMEPSPGKPGRYDVVLCDRAGRQVSVLHEAVSFERATRIKASWR